MERTFFSSASELRKWLRTNHSKSPELLIGFYKKDSGKGGITYPEALDEALCFGWIDGVRKNADESSYTIRFTPRKPGSTWSVVNTTRMQTLIEEGRVQPSGLAVFEKRDENKTKLYSYEARSRELDPAYVKILQANQKAWEFFTAQPPYYRKVTSWFVMSAKQEQTRQKRLALIIHHSERGERIPQSLPPKQKS